MAREQIDEEHRDDWLEIKRLCNHGCEAQSEAQNALCETIPTTRAGAICLISLLADGYEGYDFEAEDMVPALESLRAFLQSV
jgi:hypothetical protein